VIKNLLIISSLLCVTSNLFAITKKTEGLTETAEGFLARYNVTAGYSFDKPAAFYLGYLEIIYERPDLLRDQMSQFMDEHSDHINFVPYTDSGFTKNFVTVYEQQKERFPSRHQNGKIFLTIYQHQLEELSFLGVSEPKWISKFDKILIINDQNEGVVRDTSTMFLELMKRTSETSSPALFVAEGDTVAHEILTNVRPELEFHLERNHPTEIYCALRLYPEIYGALARNYPLFSFAASEFALTQKESVFNNSKGAIETTYSLREADNTFFDKGPVFHTNTKSYTKQFSPVNFDDNDLLQWLELLKTGGVFTRQTIVFKDKGWVDAIMTEDGIAATWMEKNNLINVVRSSTTAVNGLIDPEKVDEAHTLHFISPTKRKTYSKLHLISTLEIRVNGEPEGELEHPKSRYLYFDLEIAERIARQFNHAQFESLQAFSSAMTSFQNKIKEVKNLDMDHINKLMQWEFADFNALFKWNSDGQAFLDDAILKETDRLGKRDGKDRMFFTGFASCAKFFEK